MKNTGRPQRFMFRLTALAAVFTAIFLMTVMSASAATIKASDVTIRNTAEDKSDYSNAIGILNEGDQVVALSKTTDFSGIEWYYVELENGNRGYVKAQWVDLDDEEAVEEESAAQKKEIQEADDEDTAGNEEAVGKKEAGGQDEAVPDDGDGLIRDDEEKTAGTPASADETAGSVSDEEKTADTQYAPDVDNGQGDDPERLSDAEAAARKSAAAAEKWRVAACILIVTQILTIVLLLMLKRYLDSALKRQKKPQITGRTNPRGHHRQGSLAPQDDPSGNLTITREEDLDM